MKKAEKIQCRALRFLYYDFESSYDDLLSKGDHRSISVILLHAIAVEVFKCLNGLAPKYMSDMFEQQNHCYDVRSLHNLKLKKFKTLKYGYHTFSYLGAKVWNNLPGKIKESRNLSMFKARLKDWRDTSSFQRLV